MVYERLIMTEFLNNTIKNNLYEYSFSLKLSFNVLPAKGKTLYLLLFLVLSQPVNPIESEGCKEHIPDCCLAV